MKNKLLIRSTRSQIFPERCWLFALCLMGCFHFVPEATYVKRYYHGSTHTTWKITGLNFLSAAHVMGSYLTDLIDSTSVQDCAIQDLRLNAIQMAQWQDAIREEPQPSYLAVPGALKDQIRNLQLPLKEMF